MSAKLLQQILKNAYGKPTWLVRQRAGPSILLEFGNPKLHIRPYVSQPSQSPYGRKFPKRWVHIFGDWHLNTNFSDFEIWQGDLKICSYRSKKEKIDQWCGILDGQILEKVVVHPKTFVTDFHFDLGGHLQIKLFKKEGSWNLFCPNGRVFSLKSDGAYSYASGKTPGDKIRCSPFVFDL
jgi:hypothetical protein